MVDMESVKTTDIELNTILYGPPGTGKTYHTIIYAVAIIENKKLEMIKNENYNDVLDRYNEYKKEGRIDFTTFHQSYGYEEFIEGIKPVSIFDKSDDGTSDIQYDIQAGVFKKFCERAQCSGSIKEAYNFNENPTIWKVSLLGTGDNPVRSECMENGHIRIGWDDYGENIDFQSTEIKEGKYVLKRFVNDMQIGDIIFSCYSANSIDAIGVVTGEYEWHDEYKDYRRLRKVKWIIKGINENILSINNDRVMTLASVYKLGNISLEDVYQLLEKYKKITLCDEPNKRHPDNYVFIIDEINRGNISKVFGELITLLEPSKRLGNIEEMRTILPYSQKQFGIPNNVYVIGTMNTADRSIAMLDTALRRRFCFKEMLPQASLLENIQVGEIVISELFDRLNRKIIALYDKEHTIGHAYFMPLKYDPSIGMLSNIFKHKILPLLQEYFYDDYEKIRLILGDNKKANENEQFIIAKSSNYVDLFGCSDLDIEEGFTYEINDSAFSKVASYLSI